MSYVVDIYDNLFEVSLEKSATGLGFSVIGGSDVHPNPLYCNTRIKQIFPTGPAAHQGELQKGDVILEVNGTLLKDMTHQEIMNLLRKVSKSVDFLVCRPDEDDIPLIDVVTSELESLGTTSPIAIISSPAFDRYTQGSDEEDDDDQTNTSVGITLPSEAEINKRAAKDKYHINGAEENRSEDDTEDDSQNHPASVASVSEHQDSRTPSPVAMFLHDAGLSETDTSAAPTPREQFNYREYAEREYEITLTKGEKGLGFTVAGSHVISGYFYVKDVLYDPALSCGHINSGDRLLVVDGKDMTECNHRDAVAYLRQTPQTISLRLYRPTADERTHAEAKVKAAQNLKKEESRDGSRSVSPPRLQSKNSDHNRSGNTATPTGAEDFRDGRSSVSSFGNLSLPISDEEDEDLHRSPRPDDRITPSIEAGVLKLTLHRKDNSSLGFSLIQGERGMSSALFIHTITTGRAADLDGRLQVGDRLLQVNGESVIGMAHNKAVALIKKAKNTIHLTVTRSTVSTTSTPVREIEHNSPAPANLPKYLTDRLNNTDSDIESTTLDDHRDVTDTYSRTSTPFRDATNTAMTHTDDDGDNPNTFDSVEEDEAFKRFVEKKRHSMSTSQAADSGTEEEDDDTSWGKRPEESGEEGDAEDDEVEDAPPEKPPRKKPTSQLPSEISNAWLMSLPLVKPPADTIHYKDRQLQTTVKQLRTRLEQDDPVEEYKTLKHAKLTDNCLAARTQENKSKNRYRNVLPYDANRVKLNGPEDYINASHVRYTIGKETKHYIASQGPLPQTTGDFWRMVWEQNIEVIAMVTRDTEDGKVKCHGYWPDSVAEPFTVWDRYEISLVQVHHLDDFDIHHIKMEDRETGESHRVMHVKFNSWPDQGTPSSGVPLLWYIQFLRLVHNSGPMLVHCSAGIGRTGALITIDVILSLIEKDLKFDIQKVVQDIRRQRQGMIQTKDQYNFCYKTALQALENLAKKE